jgi:hypothetical protein
LFFDPIYKYSGLSLTKFQIASYCRIKSLVVLGLDMRFLGRKWQKMKSSNSKGNRFIRFAFGLVPTLRCSGQDGAPSRMNSPGFGTGQLFCRGPSGSVSGVLLLLLGDSAASAGQQVDVRAGLEEGIGRGLDSVDSGYGVEDDSLLLGGVVGRDCRQSDFAQG